MKNHRVVVEALQELPNNYWYIIVEKGNFKAELENIDKAGRLKLLEYRNDILELLQISDLFESIEIGNESGNWSTGQRRSNIL